MRDASDQSDGYIASHVYYDTYNYWSLHNYSLTLTNLLSNTIQIEFKHFDVEGKGPEQCTDYLLISTLKEICEVAVNSTSININLPFNEITFSFVTDGWRTGRGVWLYYKGIKNYTLNLFSLHLNGWFALQGGLGQYISGIPVCLATCFDTEYNTTYFCDTSLSNC